MKPRHFIIPNLFRENTQRQFVVLKQVQHDGEW